MNRKQTTIFDKWLKSEKLSLKDCYKHPAKAKLEAEFSILRGCRSLGDKRFRILSYNTYSFACAFAIEKRRQNTTCPSLALQC